MAEAESCCVRESVISKVRGRCVTGSMTLATEKISNKGAAASLDYTSERSPEKTELVQVFYSEEFKAENRCLAEMLWGDANP